MQQSKMLIMQGLHLPRSKTALRSVLPRTRLLMRDDSYVAIDSFADLFTTKAMQAAPRTWPRHSTGDSRIIISPFISSSHHLLIMITHHERREGMIADSREYYSILGTLEIRGVEGTFNSLVMLCSVWRVKQLHWSCHIELFCVQVPEIVYIF